MSLNLDPPPVAGAHPTASAADHGVPFREAVRVWTKIALNSFGGPAGQIAVMHKVLVEEKRWISESRFLHALNYCMLLPGPEAQQLATYIGWLMHRTKGGLVAGTLFILPGFLSILALSYLYAGYQDVTFVQALFYGLKPAVLAVVVEAVLRIGKRALKNGVMYGLAGGAFVAIFFFGVPFPVIILSAFLIGIVGGRIWPDTFAVIKGHAAKSEGKAALDAILDENALTHTQPSWKRFLTVSSICLTLWFGPLAAIWGFCGPQSVYMQQGLYFSKAAVVTFGGAYAVLAYMAQEAVHTYHWLLPGEMLDGLGMAETTPGPLIQVVQFVGFMGAYRDAGTLHPMLAGTLAAVLTTWVTFVPCFFWIFLGAPYVEALRGNRHLTSALSAITAAVVGVILNLAVWFAIHTVFGTVNEETYGPVRLQIPEWSTWKPVPSVLAVAAMLAMLRFHLGMIKTLVACGVLGMLAYFLQ
ncbi:MAG: chromate efflux transporter [Planctomycetes bacterium]|nr:chromate efflux transporter [Planctomycetota bacterium]